MDRTDYSLSSNSFSSSDSSPEVVDSKPSITSKTNNVAQVSLPQGSESKGPHAKLLGRFVKDGQMRQLPTPFNKGKFTVYKEQNNTYIGLSKKVAEGGYNEVSRFKGKAIKHDRKGLTSEERANLKVGRDWEKLNLTILHKKTDGVGIQKQGKEIHFGKDRTGIMSHLYYGDGYDYMVNLEGTEEEKFRAMAPLFTGLKHLYEVKIHHGDIKPENILFDREGPVLADFDGARDYEVTATNYTSEYNSPELLQDIREKQGGVRESACKRQDLYTLRYTVLIMMTKTYPGKDSMVPPDEILETIQDDEIKTLLAAGLDLNSAPMRTLTNILAYFQQFKS